MQGCSVTAQKREEEKIKEKKLESKSLKTKTERLVKLNEERQINSQPTVHYLLRTWSETYLALKFSIIALLAWSISFCARPRRRCERFTA